MIRPILKDCAKYTREPPSESELIHYLESKPKK